MPEFLHIASARIWTGDSGRPLASQMTIRDGVIESIDQPPPRSGTLVIDARGRTIVPGLIDSHMHLVMGAMALNEVDLSLVRSREEFTNAIRRAEAELPADCWLIARGWNEQNFGGVMPDRNWFGSIQRPCVCHRMDIHAAVVNEAVLERIGARDRADPPGGRIVRDASGSPTGLLVEAAAWELVLPLIPPLDAANKRQCVRNAQTHCHRLGLTAVGSMEFASDVSEVLEPLRASNELTLRCMITLLDRARKSDDRIAFDALAPAAGDDLLRVIGCKTFIDGTLGSRTARMLEPYADDSANRGMLVELAAAGRLSEWIAAVAGAGLSPSMHAIGDEAVRLALDAIESLPEHARANTHPRIEHVQHVHPHDLQRFRNVIASMQPLHKVDDARIICTRLGPQRSQHAFAFRALRENGAILAFGSDWPVVSCDPVLGMRCAITGAIADGSIVSPEQCLSPEQALRAYTADAAYCLHMKDTGILREGMLGDGVMLDGDPLQADWVRRPPRVLMTIVGGKVVFDAR